MLVCFCEIMQGDSPAFSSCQRHIDIFPNCIRVRDAKKLTFTPLPFDQLEDEAQYDCHGCEEKDDEKASKYQKVHQCD